MLVKNQNLKLVHRGKVRDSYDPMDAPKDRLIVASDRISAFDVVMNETVQDKGRVLTAMTLNWLNALERLGVLVPWGQENPGTGCYHHLASREQAGIDRFAFSAEESRYLFGRAMLVHKADHVIPIECVVRGYLEGSGWKSYQQNGTVCGHRLPQGLVRCGKLPKTIFTPSTKAEPPFHDENIDYPEMSAKLAGFFRSKDIKMDAEIMAQRLASLSTRIYETAAEYALGRGVIIADTKFEFGLVMHEGHWRLVLIDEVLTPDSSRFWDRKLYVPGRPQDSFDKQPLRDWLEALCKRGEWNKQPPPPIVGKDVLEALIARYDDINRRLFLD